MTTASYWASIAITDDDLEYFKQTAVRIGDSVTEQERTAIRVESIESPLGSFKYKRYVTFCMPDLPEARAWGFKNFTGNDLQQLILLLFARYADDIKPSELNILVKNPAFVSSCGKGEFDFLRLIFKDMTTVAKTIKIRKLLIREILAEKQMNLEIAALIIDSNDNVNYGKKGYKYHLDETLVIEWTKKTYGLEELPESWIRKFLGAS